MKIVSKPRQSRREQPNGCARIRKIVVAVDLSQWSREAAVYATGIARRLGASLTLIHVFDPEEVRVSGDRVYDSLHDAQREEEKRLSDLVEEIRQIYPRCDMEFRFGAPVEQIRTAAILLKAELVVIASHHATSLIPFLATDQARALLRNLRCPVLVYQEAPIGAAATSQEQPAASSEQSKVS
jgi:nucleotide-binding universal stress UspA family protein